jgi:glutathione S-transferase
MLELYQFEACPYCAKVRSVMTELELDYITRNVPRGSHKRDFLQELGGKQQVPFLVDQDRGVKMYESEDIITYLRENYGS